MGILEPVGTVPEHRRRGLGRAVVYEAIRRAAALGAEKVVVGAGLAFYLAMCEANGLGRPPVMIE